jgi:hypothetical protein
LLQLLANFSNFFFKYSQTRNTKRSINSEGEPSSKKRKDNPNSGEEIEEIVSDDDDDISKYFSDNDVEEVDMQDIQVLNLENLSEDNIELLEIEEGI